MGATPAKLSIHTIVLSLFPWLSSVVAEAGEKGRGLCIRAAGGLLHLAGGPGDRAVHRVGDAGTAGALHVGDGVTTTVVYVPPGGGAPVGILLTYLGTTIQAVAVPGALPGPAIATLSTESTTGSELVTCG